MRRVLAIVLIGCGANAAPPPAIVAPVPPAPSGTVVPAATRPLRIHREPRVALSFHDGTGEGSWTNLKLMGGPEEAVRDCYVKALDDDSDVAGWLWLDVDAILGGNFRAKVIATSPLPPPLVSCVVAAIGRAHYDIEHGEAGPTQGRMYVSLASTAAP